METPAISVLLPVRNGAATIVRCVRSLREQSRSDFEIVAVDDGSTDGTGAMLDAMAASDARLRVFHPGAIGLPPALNRGLALCRGRYVARMDADDWSHPARLAAQAALLDARPEIGVAGCLVRHVGDAASQAGYAEHVRWMNGLIEPEEIARERFVDAPVAHPSVMARRECFERFGTYADGDFPEDYDLWLRWMQAGVRFAKVRGVLLEWHDLPARLSRTHERYGERRFDRCKAFHFACLLRAAGHAATPLWFWGAGAQSGRRARVLMEEGVIPSAWIEVNPRRIGSTRLGRPVHGTAELPAAGEIIVLGLVGSRGARETIRPVLQARGYREGRDFWFMC